jgi:hypothetical protein
MTYNIVTNYQLNQIFRQNSKYYKIDLGQAITLETRSGDRELNPNDQFAFSYNSHYKASILRQGSIGDINFYTDHKVKSDQLNLYIDVEEFIYQVDIRKLESQGVDIYFGEILKSAKDEYEIRTKETIIESVEEDDEELEKRIRQNPGNARYEDIVAYMNKQKQKKLNGF